MKYYIAYKRFITKHVSHTSKHNPPTYFQILQTFYYKFETIWRSALNVALFMRVEIIIVEL